MGCGWVERRQPRPLWPPSGFACTHALSKSAIACGEDTERRRHRVDCGSLACVRRTMRMERRRLYRPSLSSVRPQRMRRPWQRRCRQSAAHVAAGSKKTGGATFRPACLSGYCFLLPSNCLLYTSFKRRGPFLRADSPGIIKKKYFPHKKSSGTSCAAGFGGEGGI